jgi:hypothetical protein
MIQSFNLLFDDAKKYILVFDLVHAMTREYDY